MNHYLFPLLTEEVNLPLYVKGVGGLENQDHITRPGGYHDYQWLHCIKGKGRQLIDGKEFLIGKNTGFFMVPGIPHEYFAVEEPWETHWVTFDGGSVSSLLTSLGFGRYGVFCLEDIRTLDSLIYDIFILSRSKGILPGYRCSAKLYSLLVELSTLVREKAEEAEGSRLKKLRPVLDYLELNYSSNPTIEELSAVIGVSPQYLCRLFNQVMNMRPFVYLNLFKLQKAKEMLINSPRLHVKDIAGRLGYNDPSYFCSIFKKHEGITPAEFRNAYIG